MSIERKGRAACSAQPGVEFSNATKLFRQSSHVNSPDEAKRLLPLPFLMAKIGDAAHANKSARCPLHDDGRASFSVFQFNGKWFWKCHAGCGHGDEVHYLKARFNLSTGQAIRRYCELAGLRGGAK
jgi:hypothetical protein